MINLFAADAASGSNGGTWMYILLGGFLILMFVTTFIPQRKRQKQAQQMKASVAVGTRIKTIGGFIGVVLQMNDDGTMVLNVGTEESPSIVVMDKNAILTNLDAPQPQPKGTAKDNAASTEQKDIFGDKEQEEDRTIDD